MKDARGSMFGTIGHLSSKDHLRSCNLSVKIVDSTESASL